MAKTSKPWAKKLKETIVYMQKQGFANNEIEKYVKKLFNKDHCHFVSDVKAFLKDKRYQKSLINNKKTKYSPPRYKKLKEELIKGLAEDCKVVDKDD